MRNPAEELRRTASKKVVVAPDDAKRLWAFVRQFPEGMTVCPVRATSRDLGWLGRKRMLDAIADGVERKLFYAEEHNPGWWLIQT